MKTCALIDKQTNIVTNVIVANPETDPTPTGYLIVEIPPDLPVTFNWIYDENAQLFINPNPLNVET